MKRKSVISAIFAGGVIVGAAVLYWSRHRRSVNTRESMLSDEQSAGARLAARAREKARHHYVMAQRELQSDL